MPNTQNLQWSNIHRRLLLLDKKTYIPDEGLVWDIYENRCFLEARFAQVQDLTQAVLEDYK